MDDSELIPVIVPIYNKAPYLEKCIDSIIGQTYKNIEIILINDGSTDGSLKICKQYAKTDERIKIVNKSNGGLSSARNAGIREINIKARHVIFIDADDYINENYIELLASYNADLVVCGLKIIKDGKTTKQEPVFKKLIDKKKIITCFYDAFMIFMQIVCAKIYRLDIIKKYNLFFDESLTYGEDLDFNLRYVAYIDNVIFIPYAAYCNNIIRGTLSRRYVEKMWQTNGLPTIRSAYKVCSEYSFETGFANLFTRQVKIALNYECTKGYEKFREVCLLIKSNHYYRTKYDRNFNIISYNYWVMRLMHKGRYKALYVLIKTKNVFFRY